MIRLCHRRMTRKIHLLRDFDNINRVTTWNSWFLTTGTQTAVISVAQALPIQSYLYPLDQQSDQTLTMAINASLI